jgi:hypothetical protein
MRTLALVLLASVLVACGHEDGEPLDDVPPFGSGLAVSALAAPQCPVETDPPQPGCEPKPIAVEFVVVAGDGTEVARGTTRDVVGTVLVKVPAGTYTVRGAAGGGPPTVTEMPVTIPEREVVEIDLAVDTGIR